MHGVECRQPGRATPSSGMPQVHLWGDPEDLVRFVGDLRRDSSESGRNERIDNQNQLKTSFVEQLEEEIRRREGKRDDIKYPGQNEKKHASQDDGATEVKSTQQGLK